MNWDSLGYTNLEKFPSGKANEVYLARYNEELRVIKKYSGERTFKAYTEFHLYKYLQQLNINSPKVYDVLEDRDNTYLILEYLKGVSLNELITTNKVTDSHINKIVDLKKHLSEISLPGYGYINLVNDSLKGMSGSWEEFLIRSTCNEHAKLLVESNKVDRDLYKDCEVFINKHIGEFGESSCRSINHGDFNPGNIMFVGDEVYAIDLELAVVGSPFYDFAWIFNHFIELNQTEKYAKTYSKVLDKFNKSSKAAFTPYTIPLIQIVVSLRSLMYWSVRDTTRFNTILVNINNLLGDAYA